MRNINTETTSLPFGTIFKTNSSFGFLGSKSLLQLTSGYEHMAEFENVGQRIEVGPNGAFSVDYTESAEQKDITLCNVFFVVTGCSKYPEVTAQEVLQRPYNEGFEQLEDGFKIRFLHSDNGGAPSNSTEGLSSVIYEGPEIITHTTPEIWRIVLPEGQS